MAAAPGRLPDAGGPPRAGGRRGDGLRAEAAGAALDGAVGGGGVGGHRQGGGEGVLGVMARDDAHHQGAVGHGAGQGPRGVLGPAAGHHAVEAHAAPGGPEADAAVVGRGVPDGAAGVLADGPGAQPRRRGDATAARLEEVGRPARKAHPAVPELELEPEPEPEESARVNGGGAEDEGGILPRSDAERELLKALQSTR